jgi:hypothetical protein
MSGGGSGLLLFQARMRDGMMVSVFGTALLRSGFVNLDFSDSSRVTTAADRGDMSLSVYLDSTSPWSLRSVSPYVLLFLSSRLVRWQVMIHADNLLV